MSEKILKPSELIIERAQVSAIGRLVGAKSYDDLYRFSIARPDAYWATVMTFLRVQWSQTYHQYMALPDGLEFPQFFTGGTLNWVDTALAPPRDARASVMPALIAYNEGGAVTQLTYGELRRKVASFAGGLRTLGVGRGDRVGLFMESSLEAAISLLAVAYLGAIVVPLFSGFGSEAIVSRLNACAAKTLIATAGFRRRGRLIETHKLIDFVRQEVPSLSTAIVKPCEGAKPVTDSIEWQTVVDCAWSIPSAQMGSNDSFMIIFTSGTTGRPKGTVHTHAGFPLKIAHDAAVFFDVAPGDVWFWPADMGWVAGPMTLAAALIRKATLVFYDGAPDYPSWDRMGRIIEDCKATHFGASPTLVRALAANESLSMTTDRSSVRILITAGEVIDSEHFSWFSQAFHGAPVINFTGGTEVTGGLLSNVVVRPIVPGGFNTIAPAIEVDVVDATGAPVVDAIGELAIRKPFVGMTKSFWNDRGRYLETYWSQVPGTWIHGDLAMRRGDGVLFLLGRSDDTLKIAGKRLGPAEVEEIVLQHPDIGEAAAVGVEDAKKGEKLVLFLVATPGAAADKDAVSAAVGKSIETQLGRAFRPACTYLVAGLPKTKSGKIMRRLVRNSYTGAPIGDLSSLEDASVLEEFTEIGQKERGETL
jgi:acetyl-CoA synthetase